MLTRKSISWWLIAAAGFVGIGSTASAATCQGPLSSTWNTTVNTSTTCGATKRATSKGTNKNLINQTLTAELLQGGLHSYAQGYTGLFTEMPNCQVIDPTLGGGGASISSGCLSAAFHRPFIVF